MKIQLAFCNLTHYKARTAVAVAGVAFAVILIFMQLGFLGATGKTATLIYDGMIFDLMIRSPYYVHLCDARTFPRSRVDQAAAVPGVEKASCFYVGLNEWRHPDTGQNRGIIVLGMDPDDPVFSDEEIRGQASKLGNAEFLLVDRKSKPEYGPRNGERFGDDDLNVRTLLGGQEVQIRGHFELGSGFAANGAVLTSDIAFCHTSPLQTLEQVNLGLIQVRDKTAIPLVKQRLARMLEDYGDVEVLTRDEVNQREKNRWVRETSIGTVFLMGAAVSLVVGIAIVYQVLSSDVANLISEFATLKAVGYRNGYLCRVIVQQAVTLAVFGFLVGLAVSWALYGRVGERAGVPIEMTTGRIAGVLLLSIAMCSISGLAAARKICKADPADLY